MSGVICQMEAKGLTGLTTDDLDIDGKLHRFRPDWEPKASKKRAWYVLFKFRTDAGVELISGSFGWFKGADSYSFNVDIKPGAMLSSVERSRLEHEQAEKRRIAQKERSREAKMAAEKSLSIWNACNTSGHSQYLQRKKVPGYAVRYSRGSIVVPVHDFEGCLYGLQFIDATGNKRFLTGTLKKGRFCLLGIVNNSDGYVGAVEGLATGCTCHLATGWPVFVAFDAGNLMPVVVAVRAKYPSVKIVIFGDDDKGNSDNPGRTKAEAAARAVGGIAIFPPVKEGAI